MHFLTLDEGFKHPRAERPFVELRVPLPDTESVEWVVQADICDEHIGFMLVYDGDEYLCEFWVWNWQTGVLVMVSFITFG